MTWKKMRMHGTYVLVLVALAWSAPAPAIAVERLFDTSPSFDTGTFPEGFYGYAGKAADLNGDGTLDYVASNWWASENVSVLMGDGSGGFLAPTFWAIQEGSLGIEVADFTGDGLPDIVAANTGANSEGTTVSLLRNLGGGIFAPQETFSAAPGPVGLVAADFDGDDAVDLAVAGYGHLGQGTTVAVLMNDGLGAFLPPLPLTVGAGPYDLEAGDLNADGRPDLAVARENRLLTVVMNAGGGSFAAPVDYITQDYAWAGDFYFNAALDDVDHDGDLDVFYSSTRTQIDADYGAISLLRNQGNGTLGNRSTIVLPRYLGGAVDIAVADVNGDSWRDLLTAHTGNGGWVATLSLGGGSFGSGVEYAGGNGPQKIAAADVDRDEDLDALVLNPSSLTLGVHLNTGDGTFLEPGGRDLEPLCSQMEAGDIDNDADLDVVSCYAYAGGGGLSVVKNHGDGTFAPRENYIGPRGAMVGRFDDLDGDGDLDLVWAFDPTSPPYDFAVRLNTGNGSFGPATVWPVGTCGTGDLITMDVDQDGDSDVLLTDWLGCGGGGSSAWVWIRRNNGDATFQAPYQIVYSTDPKAMASGDFDGDGRPDLATTHADGVKVVQGLGGGAFAPPAGYSLPDTPVDVVAGDWDGDGAPDIATVNFRGPWEGTMSLLFNQGDGTFGAPTTIRTSFSTEVSSIGEIQAQDVDLDGDLDLMHLSYGGQDLLVYENDGNGGFARQSRYVVGAAPSSFRSSDFDGDERPDLAVVVGLPPADLNRRLVLARGIQTEPAGLDPVMTPRGVSLSLRGRMPFVDFAQLAFSLPERGHVNLAIYDVSGREVLGLLDGELGEGEHVVSWSGTDRASARVPTGVYFARLVTAKGVDSVRLLTVR